MINNDFIFSKDSINIFTDASIKQLSNGDYIGSPGYIIIFGELKDNNILEKYYAIGNTTNNNAEAEAIKCAIQDIIPYRNNYNNIRLFSDSQITIFGLRDRFIKWKLYNNEYHGNGNKVISNQNIYLQIINTIIDNNLHIKLYHQSGHITDNKLDYAMKTFKLSNNINNDVDINFIKTISMYNNIVDKKTKCVLKSKNISFQYDLFSMYTINVDKQKYNSLIK